ncbi:hypothetical protein BpHYR1_045031 [Brachionus plicatilis]|uniref:Uncharacterized protein n=1 Tax=Brachionus plicatilis TaxID=10195 RepID=A0A3M7PH79_BRAPC|nr:hypothetical protein BpHYR1_045031 [Brachionus plicatilis]
MALRFDAVAVPPFRVALSFAEKVVPFDLFDSKFSFQCSLAGGFVWIDVLKVLLAPKVLGVAKRLLDSSLNSTTIISSSFSDRFSMLLLLLMRLKRLTVLLLSNFRAFNFAFTFSSSSLIFVDLLVDTDYEGLRLFTLFLAVDNGFGLIPKNRHQCHDVLVHFLSDSPNLFMAWTLRPSPEP